MILPFNFIKPFKVSVQENIWAYAEVSQYIHESTDAWNPSDFSKYLFLNEAVNSLLNYKRNLSANEVVRT